MTEIASSNVHMLRYRLIEGNVDNMRGIWGNTELKCKSRYTQKYWCVRENIGSLGGVRRVCGEYYID